MINNKVIQFAESPVFFLAQEQIAEFKEAFSVWVLLIQRCTACREQNFRA
jgi:hypothetical protein